MADAARSPQGSAEVTLSGELDLSFVPAVRSRLETLTSGDVVDMRGVTYLDSSILTELARAAKRLGPQRVTLLIRSRFVRRVLDLMKFDEMFAIVDDQSLGGEASLS